jgi:hypothetical protein
MVLATAGAVFGASPTLSEMSLSPDEVAMVLGTMIVANNKCGLKGNNFPLNIAVAKLGQDVIEFRLGGYYEALVEVKMKKADQYIAATGKPRACDAMHDVLIKFLPDIYK